MDRPRRQSPLRSGSSDEHATLRPSSLGALGASDRRLTGSCPRWNRCSCQRQHRLHRRPTKPARRSTVRGKLASGRAGNGSQDTRHGRGDHRDAASPHRLRVRRRATPCPCWSKFSVGLPGPDQRARDADVRPLKPVAVKGWRGATNLLSPPHLGAPSSTARVTAAEPLLPPQSARLASTMWECSSGRRCGRSRCSMSRRSRYPPRRRAAVFAGRA